MARHDADTIEAQFAAQKKNYFGGDCTCNKFVNCHDCRDAVRSHPYNPQAKREKVLELLKGLRRYASGEYNEAELSDNEHDMRIHLEYENRIWEIMIELRQGKDGEQK